jgi:catechol 2,3-dioxygenase-like lactoylglutathione lyase family enzyme
VQSIAKTARCRKRRRRIIIESIAMPRLRYVNPNLRARDIRVLAEWYRDRLGFQITFLWQDPPTYAMIGRDEIRVGIAQREAQFGPTSFYVHVEDLDGLYAEFFARQAVVRPPAITSYNMREFEVFDPDGNRICFGEPVQPRPPANDGPL